MRVNKKNFLFLFLFVSLGAFYFLNQTKSYHKPVTVITQDSGKSSETSKEDVSANKTYHILKFGADWCPPCRVLKPVFNKVIKEYKGVVSYDDVNVGSNKKLAQKHNVRSIPVLVFLKDGKEISRKVGAMSERQLRKFIDKNIK